MINLSTYFEEIEGEVFESLFKDISQIWEPVKRIGNVINDTIQNKGFIKTAEISGVSVTKIKNTEGIEEVIVYIEKPVRLSEDIIIKGASVLIMAGTVLEPTAIIKSPAIIGRLCHIRQGAYIRGNVVAGDQCVIGHTTEVKNSILFPEVEAGHFAYIGDTILGRHVNLGAGTKLANLQLRKRNEKENNSIKEIVIRSSGHILRTGMTKLGAVIGDFSEIGCNTVTSPGTIIGKDSWTYPNTTVSKGFYGERSVIGRGNVS